MDAKDIMTHTPGPWVVVIGKNISVGPCPGQRVALCNYDNGPQERANARLIAAAPDSHEANVLFVEAAEASLGVGALPASLLAAYNAARAAIAKAQP